MGRGGGLLTVTYPSRFSPRGSLPPTTSVPRLPLGLGPKRDPHGLTHPPFPFRCGPQPQKDSMTLSLNPLGLKIYLHAFHSRLPCFLKDVTSKGKGLRCYWVSR